MHPPVTVPTKAGDCVTRIISCVEMSITASAPGSHIATSAHCQVVFFVAIVVSITRGWYYFRACRSTFPANYLCVGPVGLCLPSVWPWSQRAGAGACAVPCTSLLPEVRSHLHGTDLPRCPLQPRRPLGHKQIGIGKMPAGSDRSGCTGRGHSLRSHDDTSAPVAPWESRLMLQLSCGTKSKRICAAMTFRAERPVCTR